MVTAGLIRIVVCQLLGVLYEGFEVSPSGSLATVYVSIARSYALVRLSGLQPMSEEMVRISFKSIVIGSTSVDLSKIWIIVVV